jgi:hypothetical protein
MAVLREREEGGGIGKWYGERRKRKKRKQKKKKKWVFNGSNYWVHMR